MSINSVALTGTAIMDKTAYKFMYISNDDTQNYPFFRLQLVVETFGHSTK